MSKIRKSARGQECQVRIDPLLCGDVDKTILAHKNGAGMALKEDDFLAAYTCDICHSYIDGLRHKEFTPDEIEKMFYEGIFRTQKMLFQAGLITIK